MLVLHTPPVSRCTSTNRFHLLRPVALLVALAIAGCGGGGDEQTEISTVGTAPTEATTPTEDTTPTEGSGTAPVDSTPSEEDSTPTEPGSTPGEDSTPTEGTSPDDGSTDSAPTVPLEVSNISNPAYQLGVLDYGEPIFTDRTGVLTDMPSRYIGLARILTPKDDRTSSGEAFLSFDVNVPTTVYLAHDDSIHNKPAWLMTWEDTGTDLYDRSVYTKTFPAGNVTLGGNTADGIDTGSMYFVFFEPEWVTASKCATCESVTGIQLSWDPAGSDVKGYRVYTGADADTVTSLVFGKDIIDAGFDPGEPRINLDPSLDLGLTVSDGVRTCFAVKAYSDDGESAPSTPVCTTL